MASAFEHKNSHVGNVYGATEVLATRLFVSVLDSVGDDPLPPVLALVPQFSAHPWASFKHTIAMDYFLEDRRGDFRQMVRINYELQSTLGFGGWKVELGVSSESEKLTRSVEILDPDGSVVHPSVQIGPKVYVEVKKDEQYTHTAERAHKDENKRTVYLIDTGVRRTEGIQRLKGSSSLVMSRRLPSMTLDKMFAVAEFVGTVNSASSSRLRDRFLGRAKATLLFSRARIIETSGIIPGQTDIGLVYDTSLEFLYNRAGWTPVEKFDTHIDEHGNESVVVPVADIEEEGPPAPFVSQKYHVYQERNFWDMVNLLVPTVKQVNVGLRV